MLSCTWTYGSTRNPAQWLLPTLKKFSFALDDVLGELLRPKGLDSLFFSLLFLIPCTKELLLEDVLQHSTSQKLWNMGTEHSTSNDCPLFTADATALWRSERDLWRRQCLRSESGFQ